MKKLSIPEDVMEYFRKTGAMGGKTRAAKHTPEELSKWGKKGGRPKGSVKPRCTAASTNLRTTDSGSSVGSLAKAAKTSA
jgi:hypothetical protein